MVISFSIKEGCYLKIKLFKLYNIHCCEDKNVLKSGGFVLQHTLLVHYQHFTMKVYLLPLLDIKNIGYIYSTD